MILGLKSPYSSSTYQGIKGQDISYDLMFSVLEVDKTEALSTLKAFGFIKEHVSGTCIDWSLDCCGCQQYLDYIFILLYVRMSQV